MLHSKSRVIWRGKMPVEKVKHTYLVVDDMDAAVAFYRDGLGLKLKFQDGERYDHRLVLP
jgi:catechol 2,3-dioxygenase-like lactoylglutathione lyase family enzyme